MFQNTYSSDMSVKRSWGPYRATLAFAQRCGAAIPIVQFNYLVRIRSVVDIFLDAGMAELQSFNVYVGYTPVELFTG